MVLLLTTTVSALETPRGGFASTAPVEQRGGVYRNAGHMAGIGGLQSSADGSVQQVAGPLVPLLIRDGGASILVVSPHSPLQTGSTSTLQVVISTGGRAVLGGAVILLFDPTIFEVVGGTNGVERGDGSPFVLFPSPNLSIGRLEVPLLAEEFEAIAYEGLAFSVPLRARTTSDSTAIEIEAGSRYSPATVVQREGLTLRVVDGYTTDEDTALQGQLPALDGEQFALGDIGFGSVTLSPDGAFTYLSAQDFHGADSFGYTVTSGPESFARTAGIEVLPVNDAPVAMPEVFVLPDDVDRIEVAATGVLINDLDVDGDAISAIPASGPALSVGSDGSFTYTRLSNGMESASYVVQDVHGATATGRVTFVFSQAGVDRSLRVTGAASVTSGAVHTLTISVNTDGTASTGGEMFLQVHGDAATWNEALRPALGSPFTLMPMGVTDGVLHLQFAAPGPVDYLGPIAEVDLNALEVAPHVAVTLDGSSLTGGDATLVPTAFAVLPSVVIASVGADDTLASGLGSAQAAVSGLATLKEGDARDFAVTPDGGSGSYSYAWSVNGEAAATDADTFSLLTDHDSVAHPAESGTLSVRVLVTDSHGAVASAEWAVNVLDVDQLPVLADFADFAFSIQPPDPGSQDALVAQAEAARFGLLDADDDVILIRYLWWRASAPAQILATQTLAAEITERGEVWHMAVEAVTDPYNGDAVRSVLEMDSVTILNATPELDVAEFATGMGHVLEAAVSATDADGDALTYEIGPAAEGELSGSDDGSFSFRHNLPGVYSFPVSVSDGSETVSGTASVTVQTDGWLLQVQASGGADGVAYFGQHSTASDSFDHGLDQLSDGAIAFRGPQELLLKADFRWTGEQSDWRLSLPTLSGSLVLDWEPDQAPAAGLALLARRTGRGQFWDMGSDRSATIRDGSGLAITMHYDVVTLGLPLVAGWQTVSLPFVPLAADLGTLFGGRVTEAYQIGYEQVPCEPGTTDCEYTRVSQFRYEWLRWEETQTVVKALDTGAIYMVFVASGGSAHSVYGRRTGGSEGDKIELSSGWSTFRVPANEPFLPQSFSRLSAQPLVVWRMINSRWLQVSDYNASASLKNPRNGLHPGAGYVAYVKPERAN